MPQFLTNVSQKLRIKAEFPYDYKDKPTKGTPTLYNLLSDNRNLYGSVIGFKKNKDLPLRQSFRTAYRKFKVIAQNTKAVIVPFGEGKEIIARLQGENTMTQMRFLLKAAQAYSVSLPETAFDELEKEGAILPINDTGVFCLNDGYYDLNSGVTMERGELELLVY